MKRLRRLLPHLIVLIVLVAGAGALWFGRVGLADWLAQRGYQAAPAVIGLTSDDGMTAQARHLFFINRPAIQDAAAFNKACTNKTEQGAVLGCYHGNRGGIFLYNVTDASLHGIEQVTAAHEMLHQAYDRLPPAERSRINGLLEAYAANGLTDQYIKDKLALYKTSEPQALDTEMHSIFGTEVPNLPPALEQYYSRYFADRSKVVDFSQAYQAAFTGRQSRIDAYDKQLKALGGQITTDKAALTARLAALDQKKAEAQSAAARQDAATYNAAAAAYNQMAAAYNDLAASTQNLINQYNDIVDARNALAVQQTKLERAIDSQAQTIGQ